MDLIDIPVGSRFKGMTVEAILTGFCLAKQKIKALVNAKALFLDGKATTLDAAVNEGSLLQVDVSLFETSDYIPDTSSEMDVLYEDEWIYALAKPPGMIIHPDDKRKTGTLANLAQKYLQERHLERHVRYMHRIDREVSGLVLFAKHILAQSDLNCNWNHLDMKREYHALVEDKGLPEKGQIRLPIGKDRHRNNHYVVTSGGKPAVTNYHVLKRSLHFALVRIWLETGRTHQIRVHLAHLGHPVVGDVAYGAKVIVPGRIMLHSSTIGFFHPLSKDYLEISAKLPSEFEEMLKEDASHKVK